MDQKEASVVELKAAAIHTSIYTHAHVCTTVYYLQYIRMYTHVLIVLRMGTVGACIINIILHETKFRWDHIQFFSPT